jgi:acyl carrier protein
LNKQEAWDAVEAAVMEALGVEVEDVTPDATIRDELGAESIDVLDMLFRVERKVGVKIKAADLAAHLQGGIPDDEFGDENEIVTPRGLAHLKTVMPQIDLAALAGRLEAKSVIKLFTVQNLADLVEQRAAANQAA